MLMKHRFLIALALILSGLACVSCGSNGSKKTSVCPICKESLDGKTVVKTKSVDGQTITVCSSCYSVGKQMGYCL